MKQAGDAASLAISAGTQRGTNTSGTDQPDGEGLSPQSVELIFRTFARRFGYKWRPNFEDPKARKVWELDLRHEGISDRQVRMGLRRAATLEWPPSTGEFIKFCRPSVEDLDAPDPWAAYQEASRASHPVAGEQHRWSHPAVYHAARQIGTWQLSHQAQTVTWPQFRQAYQVMLRRYAAGEDLEVPVPRALEHKDPPRSDPETGRRWMDEIWRSAGLRRRRREDGA